MRGDGYNGRMSKDRSAAAKIPETRSSGNAERVRQFHEAIGESPPGSPTFPDAGLLALRRKLIEEENAEVMEALSRLAEAPDEEREERFSQTAHELADLLYVTYGALVWFGIDADAVFDEVHQANMRKTSGPKRADGKQLKPPGWEPADVAAVIERGRRQSGD